MIKPPPFQQDCNSGFTLVELVVTMIIIGILAVVALPRFDLLRGYDEIGYRDKVKATLEYARKSAVAQRRYSCVSVSGSNLTLTIDQNIPEAYIPGTCPANPLALPTPDNACGGATNQICAPSGITLAGPATLTFTPLGKPSAAGGYTVTGDAAHAITVEAETGYVH